MVKEKVTQMTVKKKLSPGKAFYKHLMNGVSNMLPLVISGGILMAIVFLFGANSFDPKAQSTMRLQSSFGTLVVKVHSR